MRIMKKLLPLITAAAMTLAGCTLPGERQKYADEDFNPDMDYSDAEIINQNEIVNYTWFLEPTVACENIIVFDGSQIDTSLAEINQMYRSLAVICQNGLYGFIDYNGSVIIRPKYKYYMIDPGGQIVLYNITNEKKGTREYCTMDKDGHVVNSFSPHKGARVRYYYDEENKKVYASRESRDWAVEEYKDKKAVVAQKASVYETYGRVELVEPEKGTGGFGLISDGEIVLDFEYDDAYTPAGRSGSFALKKGDLWGYYNSKGEKLIDVKCDGFFSSYNGELCDDFESAHPYLYSEDLLAVSIGSSFGYYNAEGGCLVKSTEFAQARPVHHLKAWVCKDGYWGIISFGEDDEEPVTTTTTTTTTVQTYAPVYTTTEEEDDEDEDYYYDEEFDRTAQTEPADPFVPGGENEFSYDNEQQQGGEIPVSGTTSPEEQPPAGELTPPADEGGGFIPELEYGQ